MQDPQNCKHENFKAKVRVDRLLDSGGFSADVNIECAECETPFHFIGVPGGISPREPRCDPFGLTLVAPIAPGPLPEPIQHSTFEVPPPKDEVPFASENEQ